MITLQLSEGDAIWVALALRVAQQDADSKCRPNISETYSRLNTQVMALVNNSQWWRGWTVVDTTSDAR